MAARGAADGAQPSPLYSLRTTTAVHCVKFSRSSELLFSGEESGQTTAWSLKTHRPTTHFSPAVQLRPVLHLDVYDSSTLVTQEKGGIVRVWDVEQAKELASLSTESFAFCRFSLLPMPASHGPTASHASLPQQAQQPDQLSPTTSFIEREEEKKQQCDAPTKEQPSRMPFVGEEVPFTPSSPPPAMRTSKTKKTEGGGVVDITSTSSGALEFERTAVPKHVANPPSSLSALLNASKKDASTYSQASTSANSSLAATSDNQAMTQVLALPGETLSSVFLWDLRTKTILQEVCAPVSESSTRNYGMCMSTKLFELPESRRAMMLSCYENGGIGLWDIAASKWTIEPKPIHIQPALCCDVGKTGVAAVSGGADDVIAVIKLDVNNATIESTKEFKLPANGIADVKIRQDQKIFATAGWDHRVRIYDWKKLRELAILKFHTKSVHSIDFQHTSNLIATGGGDARIAIWALY